MASLNVSVTAETKITLDALSTLFQASLSRTVEILTSAHVEGLPITDREAIRRLKSAAIARMSSDSRTHTDGNDTAATYHFSRLCFKRDIIEPLAMTDSFRVITPHGTFQMTKRDFQEVFTNVAESRSYLEHGLYHYRVLPARALQFRVES